jgi:hypothetical protein
MNARDASAGDLGETINGVYANVGAHDQEAEAIYETTFADVGDVKMEDNIYENVGVNRGAEFDDETD